VILNPLEQLALILQTVVQAQRRIACDLLGGEEAIWSNTIIEVDYHHLSLGGFDQTFAIKICVAIDDKTTSLNEDKYW
jgi:hypothetical protein